MIGDNLNCKLGIQTSFGRAPAAATRRNNGLRGHGHDGQLAATVHHRRTSANNGAIVVGRIQRFAQFQCVAVRPQWVDGLCGRVYRRRTVFG